MAKLRLLFTKEAQASYISHLDTMRTQSRVELFGDTRAVGLLQRFKVEQLAAAGSRPSRSAVLPRTFPPTASAKRTS